MLAGELVEVMRTVDATDLSTCDDTVLESVAAGLRRVRCWLDATETAVVARRVTLASAGGGRSGREAEVVVETAATRMEFRLKYSWSATTFRTCVPALSVTRFWPSHWKAVHPFVLGTLTRPVTLTPSTSM